MNSAQREAKILNFQTRLEGRIKKIGKRENRRRKETKQPVFFIFKIFYIFLFIYFFKKVFVDKIDNHPHFDTCVEVTQLEAMGRRNIPPLLFMASDGGSENVGE